MTRLQPYLLSSCFLLSGLTGQTAPTVEDTAPDLTLFLGRVELLPASERKALEIPNLPPVGEIIRQSDEAVVRQEEAEQVAAEEAVATEAAKSAGEGSGIVEGVVFDAEGKGIPGVILTLPDLGGFQTRTGVDGRFRIIGLPASGVTVEFLKTAYLTKLDVFQMKEEGVTKVRIPLELKPVELAADEYLLESQEVLLDYQEEETTTADVLSVDTGPGLAGGGLSREFLSKAGASDAAGAVSKISGANVVGGRFVVVRGLGDRYNNTTLNGGLVPSPETSRKAVQLDLFPSEALQGVAIQKTASPNAPADFVGGIVKLQTLDKIEEDFISLKVKTRYDVETQSNGDFFSVPGLDISSDLKADNPVPLPTLRTNASGEQARQERQAFFDAVQFRPRESDPDLDREIGLSFAKNWELGGNVELSVLGSFVHNKEQRFRRTEQSRFQNAIQLSGGATAADLNPRFADLGTLRQVGGLTLFDGLVGNFTEDQYSETEEFGGLVSAKLKVGDNLDLTGSYFLFRSGESAFTVVDNRVTDLADFDLDSQGDLLARNAVTLGGNFAANSFRQIYELLYRELRFGNFGGVYRFDDWGEDAQISWNAYTAQTNETSPRTYELRGFFLREQGNAVDPLEGVTLANPDNLSNPNSSSFVQFETEDQTREFKVDGVLPLIAKTDRRKVNLIGGLGSFDRERQSDTSSAIIASGGRIGNVSGAIDAADRLLNDEEVGTSSSIQSTSNTVPGRSALGVTQEYLGTNEITSLYLGLDIAWDSWFLLGGLRFEEETRGFEIPGGRRGLSQTTVTEDLYPSLDFGRKFGRDEQFSTTLSYSETVVRPTFYEFIPARILDLSNQRVFVGNRELRETTAQNFDFSLQWKKDGNFAGINVFYKIIEDPIFTINDPSGAADRTFVNLGETEVSGIELEGSYVLGGGFSVTGNVSLIQADAQPGTVTVNRQDFQGEIDRLEGQPDLLGNFILSWEHDDLGLSTNLIYSYTGEYLEVASLGFLGDPNSALPNEVRQPFHSLDWNITKKWEGAWADYQLKFEVKNILDSDVEVVYEGLADSLAPAEAFSPGREFGLSFEAKF